MSAVLDEGGSAVTDERGGIFLDDSPTSTVIPLQTPRHAGLTLAMAVPEDNTGDLAPTGVSTGLLVINEGVADAAVILPVVATPDGQAVASRRITIPAGRTCLIPVPASVYGPGLTAVNYESAASLLVASVKMI